MIKGFQTINKRLQPLLFRRFATTSAEPPKERQQYEEPWKNPWKHALPPQEKTFTDYEELQIDFRLVEELLPKETIPEVPNHESYPTPSGWKPPLDPPPNLPYYVRRRRDHVFPLYLERKRDMLNEDTLDFDYVELVAVRNVEGDVFACEADLRAYLENKLNHPVATHVDEIKGRIKVKGADRSAIERIRKEETKSMPASAGCTNCSTKYTLFNKEVGCPACHFSFCKKCLSHKAHLPGSTKESIVCIKCYNKLSHPTSSKPQQHGSSGHDAPNRMYPSIHAPSSSSAQPPQTANWWGEGLPPASMRVATNPNPWNNVQQKIQPQVNSAHLDPLEKRLNEVRQIETHQSPHEKKTPTLSEIEERLAALRGCDVELVRNPRVWFDSKSDEPVESSTVDGLLRMAYDRNRIEENRDRELEERWKRIKTRGDDLATGEQPVNPEDFSDDPTRFSTISAVSGNTEFSEATKDEMQQINDLMLNAQKSIKQSPHPKPTEDELNNEAKTILAETRQKSLDIDKVNSEIANCYNRRIDNVKLGDDDRSSSSESLDEATLRQIMEEAERAEDENTTNEVRQEMNDWRNRGNPSGSSPSKEKGFLRMIFKK
ncbi:unnamed protein product, partial [Mesorhabditis belari]|uniref:Large ribosomal subunit protein mL49 n=1 Tax=Mesorhabditis belari TaxID=2138241 RepID=A0AAF3ESJ8_9BILA